MEYDVLDSLDDLGYCDDLSDDVVKEAFEKGTKSLDFINLVVWFAKELQAICNLDSHVNPITDLEDVSSFLLEVSSLLKELQCPYKVLISGPISQRLLDVTSRRTLLDFLSTELHAARLIHSKKNKKNALEIKLDDSSTAITLKNALKTLNIDCDLNGCSMGICLEIENKLKQHVSENPKILSPPVLQESLSEQQWQSLTALYKEFSSDYNIRRELLLARLDVTIQSFKWGEENKHKGKEILQAYMPKRKLLKNKSTVKLSDVIAAREDILVIEKTSSAELVKNTRSSLNRVLIPAVPDRGGRPKEQRPPVEMPNWMKRQAGGFSGSSKGDHQGGGWHGKKIRGRQRR